MAVINTNMSALVAQKNLNSSSAAQTTAMERLSSGLRINSAKDDAAGQAVANRMTSQVRGMQQASRNANDGVSLAQTMEGGLGRINDNLQRMRELAIQAASDTNTAADRTSIQTEISERALEITRIAANTSFNGTNLLNTAATLTIQVGAGVAADNQITLDTIAADATTLGVNALATATSANALTSVTALDAAITTVNTSRSTLGAKLNRFDSVISNLATAETNLTSARSRIEDADYATEVANLTRAQILQQAGNSVLSQANQSSQGVLKLLQ